MEIAIAVFLGLWFSVAGFAAYLFVKHDFKDVPKTEEKMKDE